MLLPFILILSLVACCVEVDMSVPGFPDMARFFKVSEGVIQLTIAVNFLGFCLAAIFNGPLSESYGRRKVMVVGNGILLLGAIGCTLAPTIEWLLIARFIQGLGASTSAVVAFAMVADAYQGEKSVKLIGVMNAALTSLMAIAPVLGGFINKAIGWRGNYTVVAFICFASWGLMYFLLPETKLQRHPFNLKTVWRDYGRLFTSFSFMSTSLVPSLLSSTYNTFIACASFLYMETFKLDILMYAFHQCSIMVVFSLVSIYSGKVIQKFGSKESTIASMSLCLTSMLALIGLSVIAPQSPYLFTGIMLIFACGFAIAYPILFAQSLEIFPGIKGTASSANMSTRAFICSATIGLMSMVYNGQPLMVAYVLTGVVVAACLLVLWLIMDKSAAKSAA